MATQPPQSFVSWGLKEPLSPAQLARCLTIFLAQFIQGVTHTSLNRSKDLNFCGYLKLCACRVTKPKNRSKTTLTINFPLVLTSCFRGRYLTGGFHASFSRSHHSIA